MAWSFPIARIFGTQLRIHFTFFFLLAGFGYMGFREGEMTGAIFGVIFAIALFTCVVLHEFGHAFAGRFFGIRTPDITLLPIGGLARLERMPTNPWHEFVIAVAGPAVNVVIAAILGLFLYLNPTYGEMPEGFPPLSVSQLMVYMFMVNISLVVFNMIPAFPMDGGRVLRSVLASIMPHARATSIAAALGQFLAVLGGLWAINNPGANFVLIFIAIFIFFAAGREASSAKLRAQIQGLTVSSAMLRKFETLPPDMPLGEASHLLVAQSQSDFPVLDEDGVFLGFLSKNGILDGLRKHGPDAPISLTMLPSSRPVLGSSQLEQALEVMNTDRVPFVPVVDQPNGPIVGIFNSQSLGEMLMVRSALSGRV
tara:strand:+ start:2337 stop:3440 length:1104 start_codon:yes stop_codon:yes gene_type:complete